MKGSFLTTQCLGHTSGLSQKEIQQRWDKLKDNNPDKSPSDGLRKKLVKLSICI